MHLHFLTRGVNSQVEQFKVFMQAQMFPWKRKNLKTGKDEIFECQGALRPIQLWEYIFPEESLDEVLRMLDIASYDEKAVTTLSTFKFKMLRRMLKCGKIPKVDPDKKVRYRYIERKGVSIYPIGVKKDKRQECEEWGYEQEML